MTRTASARMTSQEDREKEQPRRRPDRTEHDGYKRRRRETIVIIAVKRAICNGQYMNPEMNFYQFLFLDIETYNETFV